MFFWGSQAHGEMLFERSNLKFEAGIGTWISYGSTRWSHNASDGDPNLGNPSSELNYEDLNSNVIEFHSQVTLAKKWIVRVSNGYGAINNGRLIDDDFVSADGAEAFGATVSGPHRFSRTFSDIDGSALWYVNFDLGYKPVGFLGERGAIKLFIGYQHWREKAEATGLTQVECTVLTPTAEGVLPCFPAGTVKSVGQNAITNTMSWDSVRLGIEGSYQLLSRFLINGSVVFVPVTVLNNEDIHHLRTDLQKDPSFSMSGTGMGVNLEGRVSFMIIRHLYLSAGYRYWRLEVTDGTWRQHLITGPVVTANLNQLRSVRHGVTIGLTYSF